MKNYNRLSEAYNHLYLENIKAFQRAVSMMCYDEKAYLDFYPSFGVEKEAQVPFLIYGQAVNGWNTRFETHEEITLDKVTNSMEYSNLMPENVSHNPLEWVNVMWSNETYNKAVVDQDLKELYPEKYLVHSSFFWNVVYKSINEHYKLSSDSSEWSKKTVWSNLYKITPEKDNPSEALKLAQMPTSAMLVKRELEEIKPKFCLVLTGESWWAPFRNFLDTKTLIKFENTHEIISVEQYGTTSIIVTKRPHSGDSTKYAELINECLKQI